MTEWPRLKPGDKVWFVPWRRHHGNARELTVMKVGRKWATLMEGRWEWRANAATWVMDSGDNKAPGVLYASEAEWRVKIEAEGAWRSLREFMRDRNNPPPGLAVEDIRAIQRKLLGWKDAPEEVGP
jgi:hypothetical protein